MKLKAIVLAGLAGTTGVAGTAVAASIALNNPEVDVKTDEQVVMVNADSLAGRDMVQQEIVGSSGEKAGDIVSKAAVESTTDSEQTNGEQDSKTSEDDKTAAAPEVTPTAAPTVTPTAAPTVTPTAAPTVTPTAASATTPSLVSTEIVDAAPTSTAAPEIVQKGNDAADNTATPTSTTSAPAPAAVSAEQPSPTPAPTPNPYHTTSIYQDDDETLCRVEYYDENNNLAQYSDVTNFDSTTNSYTEAVYSYDWEKGVEILERTDTYVDGVLVSSEVSGEAVSSQN